MVKTYRKRLTNYLIDYVASDVHNQQQLQSIKELQLSNNLIKLLYPVIQNTISDFY